jgi:pilus assembly protein CpaF
MSTIHAHTADEALARLETLAAMAPEQVPHGALGGLVASAIDVVVVMIRDRSRRRVGAIERVSA